MITLDDIYKGNPRDRCESSEAVWTAMVAGSKGCINYQAVAFTSHAHMDMVAPVSHDSST